MAEEVAILAADILLEVIADLADELPDEVILALESFQNEIQDTIATEIATAIENGTPEEVATKTALQNSFNTLSDISEEAASAWAENLVEEGYTFEGGSSAEDADFENTDPDSNPDKGDPDTPECQDQPEGAVCEAQTQSKLSKFFEFMKNWGGTIFSVVIWGVAILVIAIGQVARWLCQAIQKIKGGCDEKCTNQKCNTALCNATKAITKFIREFWILIIFAIVILTVLLSFLFKSISPVFIGLIISLIVLAFKSILGNMIATIVCDVSATTCLVQGKPINC